MRARVHYHVELDTNAYQWYICAQLFGVIFVGTTEIPRTKLIEKRYTSMFVLSILEFPVADWHSIAEFCRWRPWSNIYLSYGFSSNKDADPLSCVPFLNLCTPQYMGILNCYKTNKYLTRAGWGIGKNGLWSKYSILLSCARMIFFILLLIIWGKRVAQSWDQWKKSFQEKHARDASKNNTGLTLLLLI